MSFFACKVPLKSEWESLNIFFSSGEWKLFVKVNFEVKAWLVNLYSLMLVLLLILSHRSNKAEVGFQWDLEIFTVLSSVCSKYAREENFIKKNYNNALWKLEQHSDITRNKKLLANIFCKKNLTSTQEQVIFYISLILIFDGWTRKTLCVS